MLCCNIDPYIYSATSAHICYCCLDCPHKTDPDLSLPYRSLAAWLVGFRWRLRYYFGFFVTEGADNVAGLGFSGYDKSGRAKWDLVTNVDVLALEFPQNVRSVFVGWNRLTATWMRRCVHSKGPYCSSLKRGHHAI